MRPRLDELKAESASKCQLCLDQCPNPPPKKGEPEEVQGTISRATLKDVSFCIEPGQTIALIGPTGSGKSTVINLLPRFYDVSGGRVLIDGVDVRQLELRTLRRQIGIVLQNPFFFSSTIAENTPMGAPMPRSKRWFAAKAADVDGFVQSFPNGYPTARSARCNTERRAGNDALPLPVPCSPTRASSFWTIRRAVLTPKPSIRFSRHWQC